MWCAYFFRKVPDHFPVSVLPNEDVTVIRCDQVNRKNLSKFLDKDKVPSVGTLRVSLRDCSLLLAPVQHLLVVGENYRECGWMNVDVHK